MDERMKQIYQEERDKLGVVPDADADFIALEKAWGRMEEEKRKGNKNEFRKNN